LKRALGYAHPYGKSNESGKGSPDEVAAGAVVVEINIEQTPQSASMKYTLLGKAGEILPKLMENWP
jgi:hypothetical protein